jgi:hypothetical protein
MTKKKRRPAPRKDEVLTALTAQNRRLIERVRIAEETANRIGQRVTADAMEDSDRVSTGLWARYFLEVCRAAQVYVSTDVLLYTDVGRAALITQCQRLVQLASLELDRQARESKR